MRNHNNALRIARSKTYHAVMNFTLNKSREELKEKAEEFKRVRQPYTVKRALDLDFKKVKADEVGLHKEYRTLALYTKLDDIHIEIYTNAQHIVVKETGRKDDVSSYYFGDYQTRRDMTLFNITDSEGDTVKQEVNRILTSDDCLLNNEDGLHTNLRLDESGLDVRQYKQESPFNINWMNSVTFIDGCDSLESVIITLKSPLERFCSPDGLIRNCKNLKRLTMLLEREEFPFIRGTGLIQNCPNLEELNIVITDFDFEVILCELKNWAHQSDLGNIKKIIVNFEHKVILR